MQQTTITLIKCITAIIITMMLCNTYTRTMGTFEQAVMGQKIKQGEISCMTDAECAVSR